MCAFSFCLCVNGCLLPCLSLFVCLLVCLFACLFVCLFVYLFVCLFVCWEREQILFGDRNRLQCSSHLLEHL